MLYNDLPKNRNTTISIRVNEDEKKQIVDVKRKLEKATGSWSNLGVRITDATLFRILLNILERIPEEELKKIYQENQFWFYM